MHTMPALHQTALVSLASQMSILRDTYIMVPVAFIARNNHM